MSAIKPGDVVVCVDANGPPHRSWMSHAQNGAAINFLKLGRLYRVTHTTLYTARLAGDPLPTDARGGYNRERFRKIRPADEQFIREMHAIKPVVEA